MIESSELIEFLEHNSLKMHARIDTGATSSTIHAEDISTLERDGKKYVSYRLRDDKNQLHGPYESPLIDQVKVKSSNSRVSRRQVIELKIRLQEDVQSARFTLFDRSKMTYRVLIGRDVLKAGKYLVRP